ncbi:MAG: S9 family peptidase [Steroidobacteraceae bacterium]
MTVGSCCLAACLLLLPGSPAIAAAPAAPRLVTLADHEAVKSPESPGFSRDGRYIAYVLDDQVHVVPASGGAPRAVTTAGSNAWDPYWSKDGSALYFLSDRSGSNQLWKLSLAGFGEATQVTSFEHGIDTLEFSPDESQLLLSFTAKDLATPGDDAEEEDEAEVDDEEFVTERQAGGEHGEGEEEIPEPFVITRLQFKDDAGDGYLTGDRTEHLYAFDLASKKLAQLTSGEFTESQAVWSPDGRQVVFVSNREQDSDASYQSDLWLVASGNTDQGRTLTRLTEDERVKSDPAWSPDGKSIAFLVAEDGVYASPQLAVMPAAGGEARLSATELDRWVTAFRYSRDGQWIYFTYEHEGGSRLARVRPKDGRLEQIEEGEQLIGEFDLAGNGAIAARVETGNRGPELYTIANGARSRLTKANDAFLGSVTLAGKESVSFKSADGTVVQAFVTKPPGFVPGRKYPTVLHIHGGPVGQFGWGYDFKPQYLAANGYVVVEPNPRGSTGRDQAFVRAIYQTWGITDYDDVIAAIDHVIAAGYADPDRLAVTGYSYGGYLTNVVITRTDRFKAAASGAGHSFIAANYGHDIYQKWYNWELGPPWDNRDKYDRLSPLLQAGRVSTPTLFLGGRDDWNVPVLNAELFYQSLRKRGVDTQLVVYPDAHHGGWPAEYEKDYLLRVRQWFDKYLK